MNILIFNIKLYKNQYTNDNRNLKRMCRMNIGSKNKDLYFFLMLHIFIGVIVEIKKIIYIQKYIINIIAKCYDNMYMHIHREHSEHILSINEDFLSFIMWLCSFAWKFCTTLITYNQLA